MQTVEEAYSALGAYLLAFIDHRSWDKAQCQMQVFSKMATGSQWIEYKAKKIEEGGDDFDPEAMWNGLDAALFLRDNLLATTGERIWGLIFTLYPNGKFNIEYDYNKPEGYEETDETISVNDSIKGLGDSSKSEE